jgi:hypothetical protein
MNADKVKIESKKTTGKSIQEAGAAPAIAVYSSSAATPQCNFPIRLK